MRILLLEDNFPLATHLKTQLKRNHFVVDHQSTIEGAYNAAILNDYDLMIFDRMIIEAGVKSDSLDLARKLRKEKNRVPMMFLTDLSEVGDRIQGLQAGADDYLAKPFDFSELLARVEAILRRGQVDKSEVVKVGKLKMNITSHEVHMGAKKVDLDNKEFQLLRYLLNKRDKAVSLNELIEHVWGDNACDHMTNTVAVHIHHLRKKLKNTVSIKTIYGVGYKLDAAVRN